jgi:hypothetical protein
MTLRLASRSTYLHFRFLIYVPCCRKLVKLKCYISFTICHALITGNETDFALTIPRFSEEGC